ncbi:ABC transporter permease subunit [Ensifer sp. ENS02]|uniref:ABC transporter permease n=1 Tax=Ensifer sp. ENS02 TaxID=2769290 RepID=UPI00177ACCEE|nr:ABC transporter permease subunit [Ensifer sp. ENS02]MBD9525097.1 ABC transporter permease subunit [Ensifer sp. ENS02]
MNGRTTLQAYLLLLPGLGLILCFTGVVIGMAISQSFGFLNFSGESGFSTRFWQSTTADPQLWRAFWYSARVSVTSAVLAVAMAYPLALWLRKPFPGSSFISAFLKAPLLVHGLVAAFLFINFISFQGFFNLALVKLGIIARPMRLQNDSYGVGVVFLQVWKQMPFALLVLTGAVQAIGDDILNAARDLGAGAVTRFRKIIVPLTLRSLQAALILIFIGAAGDFSFQVVAGPTSVNSMAQFMVGAQEVGDDGWNISAVVAVLLMALSLGGSAFLAAASQFLARIGRG